MNKSLYALFLSAFLLFPMRTHAQRKDIFIGLKGGLSIPSLKSGETKNDWNKNYESRLGPYFGLLAEFRISNHFSFQPEITYAAEGGKRNGIQPMTIPEQYLTLFQQAFKTDKDYIYANLNSVSRINYVQLPLMIKYTYPIAAKGKWRFFAQAGPYLGYMVASKQIVKSDDLKVYLDDAGTQKIPSNLVHSFFGSSIDTTIDAHDELHRWNVGIQGAVGLSYTMGKGKVFIEGGGNYGFLYIQKSNEHGKNNIGAGTVLLGYAYQLQ